jgi:hypothetical protein
MPALTMTTGIFAYGLLYGISVGDVPLIVNGVLVVLAIRIMAALFRTKHIRVYEWALFACVCAGVVLAYGASVQEEVFFFSLLVGLCINVLLPVELFREKHPGSVDVRFLFVFLGSSFFWTIYGLSVGMIFIGVTNAVYFFELLTAILLWFYYKRARHI